MKSSVTIKNVAEYAKVAISTVSRVINNKDRVSPNTRKKIFEAIEALGYVRNNFAAAIKTGSTRFIITMVPDIINEFYTAVICGVESIASEKGYYTLVYTTNDLHSKELDVFIGELNHIVDGVILIPSSANSELYKNINKPIVLIDRDVIGSEMYSVCIDNYRGASLLIDELIQNGHSKIAIITGPRDFNVGIDRLRGYVDMLSQNFIPLKEEYMLFGNWYQEDGYRLTNKLLELEDSPTAIFAANNLLCIGCVECLIDHGLTIGKDISLVGFDDSLIARYLGPGITGIRRATNEMGQIGAEMLLSILSNHQDMILQKKVTLDVEMIKRNSVVNIKDSA